MHVKYVRFETGMKPVVEKKRRDFRVGERCGIDYHFYVWEHIEPGLALQVRGPQQLFHGLIVALRQTIGLRLIRRDEMSAYVELVAQFCPKGRGHFCVPVRYDTPR